MFLPVILYGAFVLYNANARARYNKLPAVPPLASERAALAQRPDGPLTSTFIAVSEIRRDKLLASAKRQGFSTQCRFDFQYDGWRITLTKPLTHAEIPGRLRELHSLAADVRVPYLGSE